MALRTWIRRFLKLVTALSFVVLVVGAATIYLIGLENNPFILYGDGEVYGPLNFVVFIVLAALFLGGLALLALLNLVTWVFGSHTGQTPDAGGTEVATSNGPVSPERTYLRSFRKSNFYLGLILAVVLGARVGIDALVDAIGPNQLLDVIGGFLTIAVEVFGGQTVLTVAVLAFFGIWYGLKREAIEAALAGIAAWILVAFVGLGSLSTNASGFGLVLGGLYGTYYGIRAIGETEPATTYGRQLLDAVRNPPSAGPASAPPADGSATDRHAAAVTSSGPVTALRQDIEAADLRSLDELWTVVDVDPDFVHPGDAGDPRLTFWSYLSYGLGGLILLAVLLVGIRIWGFPALGLWGIPVGALYLGHGFGLPQRSEFVHVGGLVWYGFGSLLALYTLSPLFFLANAGGLYLGWRATDGIRQPAELLATVRDPDSGGGGRTGCPGRRVAPEPAAMKPVARRVRI
jgi:hypothetical protein